MKIWICKSYINEEAPNQFSISSIFTEEQKAKTWKEKNPGVYFEIEEYETDD